MGRYPFLSELEVYLEDVKRAYAESTYRELSRKLLYIHRVFKLLKSAGRIDTTNPRNFREREIFAFVDWMNARDGIRAMPLGDGTQKKYLMYLKSFLEYLDNGIINRMIQRKQIRMPSEPTTPLEALDETALATIMNALEDVATKSPSALGIFGMSVFCGYAGTRLKEIRLATYGDYNPRTWELVIAHPKGERAWAEPRIVRVCPPGRQFVTDFLDLRTQQLRFRGIADAGSLPLVPRFVANGVGYWPDSIVHNVKCELEHRLGLRFDFQTLRRSYGQLCVDAGASIDAVSRAMGHSNVATTQRYYVRIKNATAFSEIDRAFSSAFLKSIPADCGKARCIE